MVMYLGNNSDESEPKGMTFAARLVPRMEIAQPAAQRNTANLTELLQYRSMIASNKSHWFHTSRPHALLMAAVDKIPRLADKVTAMGFVNN